MITAEIVKEVARTSHPATVARWSLTIDTIIRRTTSTDWSGDLVGDDTECDTQRWVADFCMLNDDAAERLAAQLNKQRPWDSAGKARAIAAQRKPLGIESPSPVLVGTIVEK